MKSEEWIKDKQEDLDREIDNLSRSYARFVVEGNVEVSNDVLNSLRRVFGAYDILCEVLK